MHQGAVCEDKAGPRGCGCVRVSQSSVSAVDPHREQSQADPVGSLQAFGKLRVLMGLLEYLTSKSSSGGCCGAELESWS